ncbi:type IV secretion system protein [Caulobacter sp.]|jgi:type IV secretion system protein VirB6|uniref:type IV secretion system protein n=2 Tax=Bacteria TaxID=2 RepID=UPI0025BE0F8E|nr:type IV secretion system protein [Caulobacter sp.]MBQ1562804.1 type IV secretion system protein [Caulobacter sp.]
MSGACPVPASDAPLVPGLLGMADCQVERLVDGGYHALFAPAGGFAGLLTGLLTVFVAIIGFQLMLGRGSYRLNDIVLSVVKLGAVLAFATQWDVYQRVVFQVLFVGPQQLADQLGLAAGGAPTRDVVVRLQGAFDSLTAAAAVYGDHASSQVSPLIGGAGFGAMLLNVSATVLIMSSLGVLLAAKIVLGALLALGPVFVALFLFDATRGLCEGWLRASLAFALTPLSVILLLSADLAMMEPALATLAETLAKKQYPLAPVYGVLVIVMVFAGVVLGALVASGMIASGLRLPRARATLAEAPRAAAASPASSPPASREAQLVRVVSMLDRRERLSAATLSLGAPEPARAGGSAPRVGEVTPGWASARTEPSARRAIAPKSARKSQGAPR